MSVDCSNTDMFWVIASHSFLHLKCVKKKPTHLPIVHISSDPLAKVLIKQTVWIHTSTSSWSSAGGKQELMSQQGSERHWTTSCSRAPGCLDHGQHKCFRISLSIFICCRMRSICVRLLLLMLRLRRSCSRLRTHILNAPYDLYLWVNWASASGSAREELCWTTFSK